MPRPTTFCKPFLVGKEDRDGGLVEHVALKLMEDYENCRLNVTTDNLLRLWLSPDSYLKKTLQSLARSDPIAANFRMMFGWETMHYCCNAHLKISFHTSFSHQWKISYFSVVKRKKNKVVYLTSSLHNLLDVDDKAQKKE